MIKTFLIGYMRTCTHVICNVNLIVPEIIDVQLLPLNRHLRIKTVTDTAIELRLKSS